MTGVTIEAFSLAGLRARRPAPAQWVKQHLNFAYVLLFTAGILCGTTITFGLRLAIPRIVQAISGPSGADAAIEPRDPVYDLKIMPAPVWHIPAPLEIDIEHAKQDLDAALHEGH